MSDPARRRRPYLALLVGILLLTAPWPFVGRETAFWWGLPVWLWWSFGWTAALSAATVWSVLRRWPEADEASGSVPDATTEDDDR